MQAEMKAMMKCGRSYQRGVDRFDVGGHWGLICKCIDWLGGVNLS